MDILVQTRNAIYNISWKGIKKVKTVNWNMLKGCFDKLLETQTTRAKAYNESPVFKQLDETVNEGYKNAPINAANWREGNSWWGSNKKSEAIRAADAAANAKLTA